MLHACVQRFDVTGNLEKFCKILGTKQAPRCRKKFQEKAQLQIGEDDH